MTIRKLIIEYMEALNASNTDGIMKLYGKSSAFTKSEPFAQDEIQKIRSA